MGGAGWASKYFTGYIFAHDSAVVEKMHYLGRVEALYLFNCTTT